MRSIHATWQTNSGHVEILHRSLSAKLYQGDDDAVSGGSSSSMWSQSSTESASKKSKHGPRLFSEVFALGSSIAFRWAQVMDLTMIVVSFCCFPFVTLDLVVNVHWLIGVERTHTVTPLSMETLTLGFKRNFKNQTFDVYCREPRLSNSILYRAWFHSL